MQTLESINAALEQVKFSLFQIPFRFNVMEKGDGFLIQLAGKIICNESKEECWQNGGKHYISKWAIKDEIILKAWKACKDFVMHEIHEAFLYKERPIFLPHYSVDELAAFYDNASIVKRTDKRIQTHEHTTLNKQDIDF